MLIRHPHRTPARARAGAILIVVLAMLALFAVIGLSFVLYAESEATSLRNASAAVNALSDPDSQETSEDFLRQLTFGTNNNTSSVFGNDLATAKFGWNGPGQNLSPYSGVGLYPDDVGTASIPTRWVPASIPSLNRRQVVNYTVDANGFYVRPNLRIDGTTAINKSTSYTYPDRANFYLAMQNPTTGEIVQPSFFRPDLFGALDPTNGGAASNNWNNDIGRYYTVRPRPRENPNFPPVPANADGSYSGDLQNLKFTNPASGTSQHNDSLWMYIGGAVKTSRGKQYAACVAPLVLDLSGRINMSVAGNVKNGGQSASNQGLGPWEVNPAQLGISAADMQQIITNRYGGSTNPPMNAYTGSANGTINRGAVPPQYSRIDADGYYVGAGDGPMFVPAAGTFNPFLQFTPRFAPDQNTFLNAAGTAGELFSHPQVFNPFHKMRGYTNPTTVHAQGMDDLMKLASRYIDPKKRFGTTEFGQLPGKSFGDPNPAAADTAAQQSVRALTTGFNVTQSWGEVQIAANGGSAKLGPVDLNRSLGDYRTNINQPYSPANVDPTTLAFAAARTARQRLAMDIFLRLATLSGFVDGTNVSYNPPTNCLNPVAAGAPNFDSLRRLAQYSANIVDAIDNDDIMTTFVWNPIAATLDPTDAVNLPLNTAVAELGNRVVFGTELPRLVVNEAYCELVNNRTDPVDAGMGKKKAIQKVQKKYWLELHNPLSNEPGTSMMSDLGGARLQYQAGVTPGYGGATYGVYEIQIGETAGAVNIAAPTTNVTGDPAGIAGFAVKCQVSTFTDDTTGPSPASLLAGTDNLNVVKPATAGTGLGTNGKNEGYYVIAPRDKHPAGNVVNTISLPDPGAIAANPLNAMMYDANTPDKIAQAAATLSSVVLRRLANPYQPPQLVPTTANYNPYISVDTLDKIPTRNRVDYDNMASATPLPADPTRDFPSIGRDHPYASSPAYGAANPNVIDQGAVPAGSTPAHNFFYSNTSYNNTALVHFDREFINSSELMHVSAQPPYMLTTNFSNQPGNYNLHTGATTLSTVPVLLDPNYPAAGSVLFRAFDLLATANRLPGIPLGGREPGRVNLNTIGSQGSDPRVLQAVLDPQQGNSFTPNPTFVPTAWTAMMQKRTQAWPSFKATMDETGVNTDDRPYKLGSGAATSDDTLFRSATGPGGNPMLFNTAGGHPYINAEPHRKAANNLTTVSDGFLVIWTVGFFEVEAGGFGGVPPTLGKELFDKVPGDLRAQYSAVVDRSAIQVPPQNPALPATPATNGLKAWETRLISDVPVGSSTITVEGTFISAASMSFIADGQATPFPNPAVPAPNASLIRLGYGNNRAFGGLLADGGEGEWVKAGSFALGPQPGTVIITLDTATDPANYPGIQRFHGGSTLVSNTLPGNPGPQPLFEPANPANRHIVPYFTRMEP